MKRAKRCAVDNLKHACANTATTTVYVEFKKYAITYDVCAQHGDAAQRGEALTMRAKDDLLLGYAAGGVVTHTDLPVRKDRR